MKPELKNGLLPGIDPDKLASTEPFPIGTPVEIVDPGIYCDAFVGMSGVIECIHVGGYGVHLETSWNDPLTNGKADIYGSRVLWFRREALRRKEQNAQS